ncbi:hypothetical protein QJS10_CPB22g01293 [Acorus calamus]|uniref:Uncharacterized protein n=1 Tax=Acorus calamus TaxID=4465 RepID=A0AAV9C2B2_ACOCL|nr:hypothetical protein QJS10_CPB22g01293 [Acorus calamus]
MDPGTVGVKFVKRRNCSSLDVSFENGVMKIPPLCIYECIVPILRNLIAFEQCFLETSNHVTFYADLMDDNLIDAPEDVKLLHDAEILRIGVSNQKEVARFFNWLCTQGQS